MWTQNRRDHDFVPLLIYLDPCVPLLLTRYLSLAFGTGSSFSSNKPAFGASTSGSSLFSGTSTAGGGFGGGFGGGTNTTSAFGSNNASTGSTLFGGNKPPTLSTGASFGGSAGGFGANTGTQQSSGGGLFGSAASPALGGKLGDCPGTNNPPFQAHSDKESNTTNYYQSITFQSPYTPWSFEASTPCAC